MSETALNKKVEAVLEDLLNSPTRKFVVLPSEAEEIVTKRVELLALYTRPGMPSELKEKFEEAIKFTEGCHKTGQNFVTLGHLISSQSKLSDADLLVSAHIFFDSIRPTSGPFANEFMALRGSVAHVLVTAARDPSKANQPKADIIRKELSGLSDTQMTMVMTEAALLVSQAGTWRNTLEALDLCSQIGLICHGILYRA